MEIWPNSARRAAVTVKPRWSRTCHRISHIGITRSDLRKT